MKFNMHVHCNHKHMTICKLLVHFYFVLTRNKCAYRKPFIDKVNSKRKKSLAQERQPYLFVQLYIMYWYYHLKELYKVLCNYNLYNTLIQKVNCFTRYGLQKCVLFLTMERKLTANQRLLSNCGKRFQDYLVFILHHILFFLQPQCNRKNTFNNKQEFRLIVL